MSSAPQPIPPSVNGWSAEYLDQQQAAFRADPNSVTPDVRAFFLGFDLGLTAPGPTAAGASAAAGAGGAAGGGAVGGASTFQKGVDELIAAYRQLGHLAAKLDPFGRERPRPAGLTLEAHGLTRADLSRPVETTLGNGRQTLALRDVIAHLEATYCGSIGVEYAHIPDEPERAWFRTRLESLRGNPGFTPEQRRRILEHMTQSEVFERFLAKRYQGAKRFSLEGGEALIPALKFMTQRAGEMGVREIILGMAHRGRLNVLKNFVGKDVGRIFTEFEDSWVEGADQGGGDVKYHRGFSGDQRIEGAPEGSGASVHLSLLNNPSHLESVNPVALGRARAKQDVIGDVERRQIVPVLIHGDAAVAGQGVVAECLNMANLDGYTVGGTVHVVINNLVGFTTNPRDGRSTEYATDIGKMIDTPVLHVNGDDPEATALAAMLAIEYRQEFRKDVFIDLWCYRKYGHNEADEPAYTQPVLYAAVRASKSPLENYARRLVGAGVVSAEDVKALDEGEFAALDRSQAAAQKQPVRPVSPPGGGRWEGFVGGYSFESPATAISEGVLGEICAALGRVPEGFNAHPKLRALLQARGGIPQTRGLCHADAELIAFAALLLDGHPVRLSGQDCRRGTFTQRHAVLRDEKTEAMLVQANLVRPGKQAALQVWDSPLSEFGVMGFDYGYSRGAPRTLVCWEAQFGDFVNGAQVMIDQYLASSEVKWDRWAGLTLLLPHGYEGQGPEHSSARLERFLQLCADDNMEVVYPSNGAQMFHLVRRQALRNFRKPLVVMTPKKYLREVTSSADEIVSGAFRHVIDDPMFEKASAAEAGRVRRVLYCSGKVYYALDKRRRELKRDDVAIVRVEQLYPFHAQAARAVDARYPAGAERVWAQEEPRNQGAYLWVADVFRATLGVTLGYAGRAASASPAVGSHKVHERQEQALLAAAVGALDVAGGAGAEKSNGHAGLEGKASAAAKPAEKPAEKVVEKSVEKAPEKKPAKSKA